MMFSEETLKNSIQSTSGEYAWRKNDVQKAIDEVVANDNAILGGDVWLVKDKLENGQAPIAQIAQEKIAMGVFKDKYGTTNVFHWYSNKTPKESWNDFVQRSKKETEDAITKLRAESHVKDEDRDKVFYNLVYCDEREFEELLTKSDLQITAPNAYAITGYSAGATPQRGIVGWFKRILNQII